MKFKTCTGITWSNLELTGLLEDEDSRVYFEKFKKHLGLHPFHLTNLNAALNEILSSNLNSYDTELKGFLMAYKNPKLLTPLGEIFYDTCFIHVDIEADFYVFRPEIGCSLKGIVNKKGLDHIGILVHKAFNVSIPKLHDEENWAGDNLEIGQEVRFVITHLDINSKLPFIRGALNPEDYLQGCRLMEKKHNKRVRTSSRCDNSINTIGNRTFENSSKRTKQHTFFATDSEQTSDEDMIQIKKEIPAQKKSKKKFEQEEVINHNEKKNKDKKRPKKYKEDEEHKPKLNKIETAQDQYIDDEFDSDQESGQSIISKKYVMKRSEDFNPQNSIEKQDDRRFKKHSTKKISKKLSDVESKDKINKISFENSIINSDLEQITEEIKSESKIHSKRKSNKSTYKNSIDEIDVIKLEPSTINSDLDQTTEEITSETKIKSKKKSNKSSHRDATDDISMIKLEQPATSNDLQYSVEEAMFETRIKSKKKSNKLSDTESKEGIIKVKLEKYAINSDSEQIVEGTMPENKVNLKSSTKRKYLDEDNNSADDFIVDKYITDSNIKKSKKADMSDIEYTEGFVRIKMEEPNESYVSEVNNIEESPYKKKHKKHKRSMNLEVSEENQIDGRNTEETSEKSCSKKSEISDFACAIENIRIKAEKESSGSENGVNEDYRNVNKKSRKNSELDTSTHSSTYEEDNEGKVEKKRKKHSKKTFIDTSDIKIEPGFEDVVVKIEKFDYDDDKESEFHSIKIKKEKYLTDSSLDEDVVNIEQYSEKGKEHNRNSLNKHKSRKSESEFDFRNVKIKVEDSSDS